MSSQTDPLMAQLEREEKSCLELKKSIAEIKAEFNKRCSEGLPPCISGMVKQKKSKVSQSSTNGGMERL